MSNTKPDPYEGLRNPHIRELLRLMSDMPKWLNEQEDKRLAEIEFARKVFEKAVLQSGIIEKLKGNRK